MTPAAAVAAPPRRAPARGLVLIFLAGVLFASAGAFTRALPFDAWTMVAWRSLAGALFTALVLAAETRRLHWRDYVMTPLHWLFVPAGAIATICYVVALRLTSVADVMIVYATTPFVTALVAWAWSREVPSRRVLVASAVALAGVAVMISGGGGPAAPGRLAGAGLVLVMNTVFAHMLVLARRQPDRSMLPLNAVSLLLASGIGFAVAPHAAVDARSFLLLMIFGVVTVGLAMTLFMAGARVAPSAEAALIGISDVVLGPLMVFVLFGENPGRAAIVGGAIVMAAVTWTVWPDLGRAWAARRRRMPSSI